MSNIGIVEGLFIYSRCFEFVFYFRFVLGIEGGDMNKIDLIFFFLEVIVW